MSSDFKYVMFDIPIDQHLKLRIHGIENDRTLKSMLQEAVARYVEVLPEYVSSIRADEPEEPTETQDQGMGSMTL